MSFKQQPKGYVILLVFLGTLVLSAISLSLLTMSTRDKTEAVQQENVLRSVYAAEGSVVYGMSQLTELMKSNSSPTPDELHTILPPTYEESVIAAEDFQIDYVDPNNNFSIVNSIDDISEISLLNSGPYAGLNARQIPIQVKATANVNGSQSTIADIMRLEQIPVFQFALFFDQQLDFTWPERATLAGKVHANKSIFFGPGASAITVVGSVSSADRIHLRSPKTNNSSANNSPFINGLRLFCDDAEVNPLGCPGGLSWQSWTTASLPVVQDQAHGITELHLPTGMDSTTFNRRVIGTPDLCGLDPSDGTSLAGANIGAQLNSDWQIIDLPRDTDNASLKTAKYSRTASVRVIDGVWERRAADGQYSSWFSQADGSANSNCVYYGYAPGAGGGASLALSDGIPAIRDERIWDFQDRKMRRILVVDMHRLTRCLRSELENPGNNGVLYIGESFDAQTDNWGLNPDSRFYELNGGACNNNFTALPHYLRGQLASGVSALNVLPAAMPAYLRNDDLNSGSTPVLDNPYYPANAFCAPTGGRNLGLGDGPMRLPQGNGNGILEPGKNELVESGVMLMNAERLPNVQRASGEERGFTIATNAPVYFKGDYNVKVGAFNSAGTNYAWGKVPSSVASDATTFVSNKYNSLQENPFAPVGPMAMWQTVKGAGATFQNYERSGNSTRRRWSKLPMALPNATAPAVNDPSRFELRGNIPTAPAALNADLAPVSPAPCVNLIRELALRRYLDPAVGNTWADNCTAATCKGSLSISNQFAATLPLGYPFNSAVKKDYFLDQRTAGADPLTLNAASLVNLNQGGTQLDAHRLMNAFVAFAPLEDFLDVSMYQIQNSANANYSSRQSLPTGRNDREILRDWMRCSLKSSHPLLYENVNNIDSLSYGGATTSAVFGVNEPQPSRNGVMQPQNGMRRTAGGRAGIDITYVNILGHDGWAPMSVDSVFRLNNNAMFTRDRSSLDDPNNQNNPSFVAANLSNLAGAAQGDQLAINTSLLTGSTWSCSNDMPAPRWNANNQVPDDSLFVGTGTKTYWNFMSVDEGLFGVFRYMESWHESNHDGFPNTGGRGYIDFFLHGSVVVMFHSPESTGRHILNQAFLPYAVGGCPNGMDYHMTKNRSCRVSAGFEYAWEASRRAITFDPNLSDAKFLPPGVPMVQNYSRLRWIRR